MTEEEQLAFWSAMNYDVTRKLLQNEQLLANMDAKLDRIERTMALMIDLRDQPSSLSTGSHSLDAIEFPSSEVSVGTVCWIHRIVTESDNLPEAIRGRFRSVEVWIGQKIALGKLLRFTVSLPLEVPSNMKSLIEWWHEEYLRVRGSAKERVIKALAEFHSRFLRVHPFLDANGRVARILLDQAARELINMRVGRELVSDSKVYLEALASADKGDLRLLERLVSASLQ